MLAQQLPSTTEQGLSQPNPPAQPEGSWVDSTKQIIIIIITQDRNFSLI